MSVDHDNLFHSHTHAVRVNYIKMYYVATQLIDPLYHCPCAHLRVVLLIQEGSYGIGYVSTTACLSLTLTRL